MDPQVFRLLSCQSDCDKNQKAKTKNNVIDSIVLALTKQLKITEIWKLLAVCNTGERLLT